MMLSEVQMPRSYLLALTLLCIPAIAQTPDIQARVTAQQNLIKELRDDLARYKPSHPQVSRSRALIGVLEGQSRLLQQPRNEWAPAAVNAQIQAITQQLSTLRRDVANHRSDYPGMNHDRAVINLLEVELRDLQAF
jgi:uncharacterized protein involved in exopolysaccharide biosynthesis